MRCFSKLVAFFVVACVSFLNPLSIFADNSYTTPSNFTAVPFEPEVLAQQSAIVVKDRFTLIVETETSPWDAYISYGYRTKSHPIRLCRYWQITDISEFKLRSHFNNAVIEPQKNTLISFKYETDMLKILPFLYFPETSLKIVESDDGGESWTMLKNSVVDSENNTVSAITKLNRGYMVVSGFVNPKINCNYNDSVKGATTIPVMAPVNYALLSWSRYIYSVLLDMLHYRSEQAML